MRYNTRVSRKTIPFLIIFIAVLVFISVQLVGSVDNSSSKSALIIPVVTPSLTPIPTPTLTPVSTPTVTPKPTKVSTPTATPIPSPTPNPQDNTIWEALAMCETGGNWSTDTGNGYFGGLQFSQGAWNSVGGSRNPAQASKDEQILRGKILQKNRGWGVWGICARRLGLN